MKTTLWLSEKITRISVVNFLLFNRCRFNASFTARKMLLLQILNSAHIIKALQQTGIEFSGAELFVIH